MAIDTAPARTRRALLAAALGAGAATVAAVLRPLATDAATGDPVLLGKSNSADSFTLIRSSSSFGTAAGFCEPSSYGVFGSGATQGAHGVFGQHYADGGIAVYGNLVGNVLASVAVGGETFGHASQTGVRGVSVPDGIGVHGKTLNGAGVKGEAPDGWAVHGVSDNRAVYGETTAGHAIHGQATSGTAVYAATSVVNDVHTGYAIRAVGRVRFDKCTGVATIAEGTRSVVVTPGIDVIGSAAVVATLQGNPGGTTTVQRVAVSPTTNTFTIYLTANSTKNVRVAWHVFG